MSVTLPHTCGSGRDMPFGVTKLWGCCEACHPKSRTLQACPKWTIPMMCCSGTLMLAATFYLKSNISRVKWGGNVSSGFYLKSNILRVKWGGIVSSHMTYNLTN